MAAFQNPAGPQPQAVHPQTPVGAELQGVPQHLADLVLQAGFHPFVKTTDEPVTAPPEPPDPDRTGSHDDQGPAHALPDRRRPSFRQPGHPYGMGIP